MGQENTAPQIDFSKYQAPAAASATIDFSKYDNSSGMGSDSRQAEIRKKYGLSDDVDLSKGYGGQPSSVKQLDPLKFSAAYQEFNPPPPEAKGFLSNMWEEAKDIVKGAFSEGTGTASAPPIPGKGVYDAATGRYEQAGTDLPGAIGRTTTDVAAAVLPFLIDQAPEIAGKISPRRSIETALGRRLTAEEATAPHPGGTIQPALNNTPEEVLQHAKKEGIDLTPGQALNDPLSQNFEKAGKTAAIGGKELDAATKLQRTKFGETVNTFMDTVDPKRAGLSAESAGEQIRDTAKVARDVSHENASNNYKQIDYLMDRQVEPTGVSAAWNKIKQNLPVGAEDSILAQTPRSMRAVVEDMLSGKPEGFKPTFAQSIELRKFFREMGETDGLPDKTQASFKQMSKAVDSAMETTAGNMNAADEWRAANAGWKDYATKYGDKGSVLYKVLKQNDPVKTVTMLQNAPATDIATLKAEGMDAALEPLRRQVVQDIAKSRFNVAHDGLGGYSDSYLKALFSPEQVKELYLKGDLAARLKYDPNPSGTAAGLQSLEQLKLGNQGKMSIAAKLSMPRDPLSFLPEATKTPVRTTPFAPAAAQPAAAAVAQPLAATGTGGPTGPTSPITKGAIRPAEELFSQGSAGLGSKIGGTLKMETDSNGLRWAISPDGYRVTVPKRIGPGEVQAYADAALEEQRRIHGKIKERNE